MSQYDRLSVHNIEEILPLIPNKILRKNKHLTEINGQMIKMNSQRYQVFKKNTVCVCCNKSATFFAMERQKYTKDGYHLNLYGISDDGSDLLFTKDHIIAKVNGGLNTLNNYQTMCLPCNNEKGTK